MVAKGSHPTEETRQKMRDARKGMKLSEEHKRNIGLASMGRTHNLGKRRTPEQKAAISARQMGRKHSEETKQKMRESGKGKNLGNTWTEEHKQRQSQLMKGVPKSEEHKKKIGLAQKGTVRGPLSEEHKQKLSASHKGKNPYVWTDEQRKAFGEKQKGKIIPEEVRRKISDGNKGIPKPKSEAHREKLRQANLGKTIPMDVRIKISCANRGISIEEFDRFTKYDDYCYKFNFAFKERVRNFFGRVCVECGKLERDNPTRLCVHHVEYLKEACCDEDIKWLFVALCSSCHSKTHYNRTYWKDHFTQMILEKYGGRCYLPKPTKIIA